MQRILTRQLRKMQRKWSVRNTSDNLWEIHLARSEKYTIRVWEIQFTETEKYCFQQCNATDFDKTVAEDAKEVICQKRHKAKLLFRRQRSFLKDFNPSCRTTFMLLGSILTIQMYFTLHFLAFLQSGTSSCAKHGGAYFSVVRGSIKDPIAVLGRYEVTGV